MSGSAVFDGSGGGSSGDGDATPRFPVVPNRGARTRRGGPKVYLRAGASWPNGKKLASAPVAVFWAAEISRRLAEAIDGRSKSAVAESVGMARSTLYDLLSGETWPDLVSICALEEELDTALWPRWGVGETS